MNNSLFGFLLLFPFAQAELPNGNFDPNGFAPCTFQKFITKMVRDDRDALAENTFFVETKIGNPKSEFWVFWPQKRQLLLIDWPVKDCRTPAVYIRRKLDLNKDVVKTDADVGTSTYLVTEAWASKEIFEAARSGYQVQISH